ncbi:MAG: ABC transporter permease [Anaerolineae bacterium]|nr:ABC transporter permease [Anaerolineae bacterium]
MKGYKLNSLWALYLANAREFLRDRITLFLVLLLPVALAVFFGLIFGGDDAFTLQVGVVNEDGGALGEQILSGLEGQEMLSVRTGTRDEMLDALNKGEASVIVVLPAGATDAFTAGEPAKVEVITDPSRPLSGGTGLSFMRTYLSEVNLALSDSPRLLVVEEKSVQTRPLRAIDFHLSGFLGISMLWKGLFSTTAEVGRLRQKQVLRRLCLTPLAPITFLAAHVAWSLTVGLLQAALFLLVGTVAFGVHIVGSWALLVAMVILGSLVSTGLGYCIASLCTSAEAGMVAIQIINFPMMMLSGSMFSVETLPSYFRPLVAVMPLTYLSDALRQLMVGAAPLYPLWVSFAVLSGWLLVFLALTIRFWRWE